MKAAAPIHHVDPPQVRDARVRAVGVSHGGGEAMLAAGDEFQQLRLLPYPCPAGPPQPPRATATCQYPPRATANLY